CLQGRSLSAAQTVSDRRATQSSHRWCRNLWHLRKTNECRNRPQTNETDPRTGSCAVGLLSQPNLCAAPIPKPHAAHRRFDGNRCNDNRPTQLVDSSTHIVSHRKRIHL